MAKIRKYTIITFAILMALTAASALAEVIDNDYFSTTDNEVINSETLNLPTPVNNIYGQGHNITVQIPVSKDIAGGWKDVGTNNQNVTLILSKGARVGSPSMTEYVPAGSGAWHAFAGDWSQNNATNNTIIGDTTLLINEGAWVGHSSSAYGGSGTKANGGDLKIDGSTNVVMNGGDVWDIFGGNGIWTASKKATITGNSNITVKGGTIADFLCGGSYPATKKTAAQLDGNVYIVIEGGEIATLYDNTNTIGVVARAGGWVYGDDAENNVSGDVKIHIKGGSVYGDILGGMWLYGGKAKGQIDGNVEILVDGNSGLAALKNRKDGQPDVVRTIHLGNWYGPDTTGNIKGTGTLIFKNISSGLETMDRILYGEGRTSPWTEYGVKECIDGTTTLVFDNVQGAFNGSIVSFDVFEATPGTKVTGLTPEKFDVGKIKITGNWTNFGTPSVLTFDRAVEVPVDFREATGIVSAEFNESKTELVVTCKNAPIAVTPTALKLQLGKSDTVKAATPVVGETVSWKSSDTAVAAVDDAGKVTAHKAGIAVISATGSVTKTTAGCTVTVEDPAAPDPVPTPAPVTPTVITEKDNPVTKDKDVPADVKPATPVIKPATEENTKALAASADVPVKFFTATADGNITVDPVIAKKTVASVMSDNAAVAPKTIVTLPIITATIDSGKVAALAMKTTGAQLGAAANNIVSDITLIKILKDETGAKFGYTAEPAGYADQSFTLKNADGNNLAFTDKIDPAATYTLILFVKDNGEFDYDSTTGSVIDPVAMAMNEAKAPKPSGGSSSGCSAGVGVLALLALLPLAAARRKK